MLGSTGGQAVVYAQNVCGLTNYLGVGHSAPMLLRGGFYFAAHVFNIVSMY
ncbi:MAG: hypothetical protein AAB642_03990 [Patescibacteria group bacterium]